MKTAILQALILFVFFASFLVSDIFLDLKLSESIERIEETPIFIFSLERDSLIEMADKIRKEEFIKKSELKLNSELLHQVLTENDLKVLDELIDLTELPDLLELRVSFREKRSDDLARLFSLLDNYSERTDQIYKRDSLIEGYRLTRNLLNFRLFFPIASLLILFVLIFFLKQNQLRKEGILWRYYSNSGGKRSHFFNYMLETVFSLILPLTILYSFLCLTEMKGYHSYSPYIRHPVFAISIVLLAGLGAWIRCRKDTR